MKDYDDDFLPGEISPAELAHIARMNDVTPQVIFDDVHDGGQTSLEFAQINLEMWDEYLESIDFLLASPLLPRLPVGEKERLEGLRLETWCQIAKAMRAVELDLERSLEAESRW